MHLNLPERHLLIGSQTFKKETIQKYVTGGHICARNAILAKQQPLETMQSFRKEKKRQTQVERNLPLQKWSTAFGIGVKLFVKQCLFDHLGSQVNPTMTLGF